MIILTKQTNKRLPIAGGGMKVYNGYAGIGGNRKLWENVEVTAVEKDPKVAKVYKDYFPNDEVIVGDSHRYLLENYSKFDFVWVSPPYPTHSDTNYAASAKGKRRKARYPDMKLYQEIILLEKWFEGKYVAENVIPYYTPLIPGKVIDRHLFWSNFNLGNFKPENKAIIATASYKEYENMYGYDLSEYGFTPYERRQKLRNCVHPETGLYILERARGIVRKSNTEQVSLFNH